MPIVISRQRTPHKLVVLAAMALVFGVFSSSLVTTSAQSTDRKPTKKDSSPRAKPKNVTVTASVEPLEAKPGETVVYKVTATLKPKVHIYPYSKEAQEKPGPRSTRFDFFDTADLTPTGEWTASKKPESKEEPAFGNMIVSYFENEVTWSIPLKVPIDSSTGNKTLRCQASYQVCNDKSCSFPGAWTLPDVVLTVVGGQQTKAETPAPEIAVAGLQPKKKEAPPLGKKVVDLTASVSSTSVKPGELIRYSITAKLKPGWHIYDYASAQPGDGPQNKTLFDFYDTAGFSIAGDWTSNTAPQTKPDEAFGNALVSYFEGEVTWTIPLKVPADAKPGEVKTLRCQAEYSVCDATTCLPPARTNLAGVALTVLAGLEVAITPPPSEPKTSAPAAEPKRVVSEVEQKTQQGLIPLILFSAGGGLLALAMPCVWPMIPITVNFFVKQGQKKNGKTTALAITYCLAIIGVFTSVGVLCSFFLSATALPRLANNPWLNFAVAGLFLAFGLSLLGFFEISLPSALLNASAKGESRGGLIGVMFMALTLTITSFTCTFPVVGGLLVMASTGQFFYPIIGLATFAAVLALPFFVLALSPGMLSKVPKSGDWMNAVKVVGGLVEIGASLKFLNTAEIAFSTPENAWIDASFVLTAWVVLSAICGLYLLGLFRTDHDYEEVKVGPGRLIVGIVFMGLALYLAPALFGQPPKGLIWDRLVIGILPPDAGTDFARDAGGVAVASDREKKATETDPEKAERQETRFHGVSWGLSYDQAIERSKAENKPILIDFTGVNCANCRLMEQRVLPKPEVAALLDKFITVQLYTDFVPISSITADQREERARKNQERQIDLTNDNTNPFYVVVSPGGKVLGTTGGYREPEVFVEFLNRSLGKVDGKVAQAETGSE